MWVPQRDESADAAPTVDVKLYGSARAVLSAAHMLAGHLATCSALQVQSLACRLEFAGQQVRGQLTVHPTNPNLFHLFEADGDAAVGAVAVVSEVDVSIGEEHVEAAVDDAVLLHGGCAGRDVDAWIAGEPRRLFAWSLAAAGAREVLASIQTMMNEETEQARQEADGPAQGGAAGK